MTSSDAVLAQLGLPTTVIPGKGWNWLGGFTAMPCKVLSVSTTPQITLPEGVLAQLGLLTIVTPLRASNPVLEPVKKLNWIRYKALSVPLTPQITSSDAVRTAGTAENDPPQLQEILTPSIAWLVE